MNYIFYIMGRSCSGKDTVFKELKKRFPDLNSVLMHTTRPIRTGEMQGVDYRFDTMDEFRTHCRKNDIFELRTYKTEYGDWHYYTTEDSIDLKKGSYLGVGTPSSYDSLMDYFKESLIPIYLKVEEYDLLSRALEREHRQKEPKYTELCRRFLADSEDFSEERLKGIGITEKDTFPNIQIDQTIDQIAEYIQGYLK